MCTIAIDLARLRPLSTERQEELKAIAAQPDDTIDFSDTPPLDEAFWRDAVLTSFSEQP